MNICAKCELVLPLKNEEYVKCGKCKSQYHFACCTMPQDLWLSKSKKHKERWKCKDCRDLEQVSSNAMTGPFAPEDNPLTHTDSTSQHIFQFFFNKHMDVMDDMGSTLHTILNEIKDLRDDIVNRRVKLDDGTIIRTSTSLDITRLGHLMAPQNNENYEIHETEKLPIKRPDGVTKGQTIDSNKQQTLTETTDVNTETDINLTKESETEPILTSFLHKRVSYASKDSVKTDTINPDEKNISDERKTDIKKERSRRASIVTEDPTRQ